MFGMIIPYVCLTDGSGLGVAVDGEILRNLAVRIDEI